MICSLRQLRCREQVYFYYKCGRIMPVRYI